MTRGGRTSVCPYGGDPGGGLGAHCVRPRLWRFGVTSPPTPPAISPPPPAGRETPPRPWRSIPSAACRRAPPGTSGTSPRGAQEVLAAAAPVPFGGMFPPQVVVPEEELFEVEVGQAALGRRDGGASRSRRDTGSQLFEVPFQAPHALVDQLVLVAAPPSPALPHAGPRPCRGGGRASPEGGSG
jgi:hypothetical protein